MFDIETKAAELAGEDQGTRVEILDATNEPAMYGGTAVEQPDGTTVMEGEKPVTIVAAGLNSKRYRKAQAWQRKEMRALGGRDQTGEEALLMQSGFVARCCISWEGFTKGGQPLPFTTDNAVLVFTRLPYVQRQVEAAMGQGSRFLTLTARG